MTNYRGGKIRRNGYWYVKKWDHPSSGKQGYVAEHRLIVEESLGRFLKKGEVVHHINHDISDNRIENLKLFSSAGQHTKIGHPKIVESQRGLTVKIKSCDICHKDFETTWKTKRRRTCSEECRQLMSGGKRKGMKPNSAQLAGLKLGHGWNKGLPMTWDNRPKRS